MALPSRLSSRSPWTTIRSLIRSRSELFFLPFGCAASIGGAGGERSASRSALPPSFPMLFAPSESEVSVELTLIASANSAAPSSPTLHPVMSSDVSVRLSRTRPRATSPATKGPISGPWPASESETHDLLAGSRSLTMSRCSRVIASPGGGLATKPGPGLDSSLPGVDAAIAAFTAVPPRCGDVR